MREGWPAACFRWTETSTTSNMPLCNPVNPAFLPATPDR
ncbi:hypothetical protein NAEX_04295 [Nannocystis exedens]|nr:hypothetical protein NAEX_04295 [Nannocystis exedens]